MASSGNQKTSVDEVAEAVREWDEHVATASQVADELGVSDPTARKWLKRAHSEGKVGRQELPNGARVWFPPGEAQAMLGEYDDGEPPELDEGNDRDDEPDLRATGGPPVEQEHSPELMSTVEDLEEGMNQLRRDVAELDADADDAPGEPYTDVRSPTRRAVLVERDYARQAATQLGVVTAAALALALVAASLPAVTVPGVDVPLSVGVVVVAGILAIGFGAATVAWGVLSILLRFGAFAWGDRTLPFRPDPDAEESDT